MRYGLDTSDPFAAEQASCSTEGVPAAALSASRPDTRPAASQPACFPSQLALATSLDTR